MPRTSVKMNKELIPQCKRLKFLSLARSLLLIWVAALFAVHPSFARDFGSCITPYLRILEAQEVRDYSFGPSSLSGAVVAVPWPSQLSAIFSVSARQSGFWDIDLITNYQKQEFRTYCGIASSCMVMRTLSRNNSHLPLPNAQEELLQAVADIKPRSEVRGEIGGDPGFQLNQLREVLSAQGFRVQSRSAVDESNASIARFRLELQSTLQSHSQQMIVNFHGRSLGAGSGGHFSPIAGYDPRSDRVLVLDVAAHKNPPFWIPLRDLYHAMAQADSGSGEPRGYLIVGPRTN